MFYLLLPPGIKGLKKVHFESWRAFLYAYKKPLQLVGEKLLRLVGVYFTRNQTIR